MMLSQTWQRWPFMGADQILMYVYMTCPLWLVNKVIPFIKQQPIGKCVDVLMLSGTGISLVRWLT